MNRIVIGALGALLLTASGIFWWQGRAASSAAPPLAAPSLAADDGESIDELPEADADGVIGPDLPEASEQSREQKRFNTLDRDRDSKITRAEMLAQRAKEFRKLDVDGNKLLTFGEWAVKTDNKFKGADRNGDGWLSRVEFVTTRQPVKKPACKCAAPTRTAKPHAHAVKRPVTPENLPEG